MPFYSHEIDAYWNDIGSIGEFVSGNLDALGGAVGIEPPAGQVSEGVYAGDGSDLDGVKVKSPLLIGSDCQVGAGADLHGPVVVGDGCKLGAGAMLRDCVVLPGAEVPVGGLVVGGLYGVEADRPLG
jgi:mannose-1-phosphate guanylyltransferase/phosphomannomutase